MDKSAAMERITICKIADVSAYLPQMDQGDVDADFYLEVSKNNGSIYGISCGEEIIGLSHIQDDADAYVYVYIFPAYRHRGYGYPAIRASEQYITSSPLQSISTAYDSHNDIARKLAERCGYKMRFCSAMMRYPGEKFDIPALPVRKHRDEDFVDAYTLSAEAFHIMRLETGYFPDSVPFVPDEETRKYCLETADDRYIYFQGDEIVGCAQLDGAELSNVSIAISHQGKGLGRAFVKFLVNEILEKGIGEPFLYCIVGNRKARQLYDSLGFREIVRNVYATKKIAN